MIYVSISISISIYIYYISYILLKLVIPDDFPKIFLTSSFFRSPWDAPVGFPELRCSHEAKFTGQALGTMPGITGIAIVEFSLDFTVYGHLPIITGYKWGYIFYKWGYKYL